MQHISSAELSLQKKNISIAAFILRFIIIYMHEAGCHALLTHWGILISALIMQGMQLNKIIPPVFLSSNMLRNEYLVSDLRLDP